MVGFNPPIVSQIGRFLVRVLLGRSVRSPPCPFVVCKARVVVDVCSRFMYK